MQLAFIIGTASIKLAEVIIGNIGKARQRNDKFRKRLDTKSTRYTKIHRDSQKIDAMYWKKETQNLKNKTDYFKIVLDN